MTTRRRPIDFVPVGPKPGGDLELQPTEYESHDYLAGDFKIFQPKEGHRWSLDDLVTAYVAAQLNPFAEQVVDLGCGLGSVLMLLAWKFEGARFTGIEAQADRAAMARKSLAYNGLEGRCEILDGDLRELNPTFPKVNLVTATPPYFPLGTGVESMKPHASPCRFEVRGGVEVYVAAAKNLVLPSGHLVLVTSSQEIERVKTAAHVNDFNIQQHWSVIPKTGKDILLNVDVLGFQAVPTVNKTLTVRDDANQWTPEFKQVRACFGMPVRQ
jgi:tRNA1Val (adenine37-N6)-methyltransferase